MKTQSITNHYSLYFNDLKNINSNNIKITALSEYDTHYIAKGELNGLTKSKIRLNYYSFYIILKEDKFECYISLSNDLLNYYLPNYKEYIILNENHKPIPKILASNIPAGTYSKSNASNCYVTKEGSFVEIDKLLEINAKVYNDNEKHHRYIEKEDLTNEIIVKMINNAIMAYKRIL